LSDPDLTAAAEKIIAAGPSATRPGRDPVNLPMIRNWLEALGDTNPVYERSGVAPPAMIQVWTMRGLRRGSDDGDPLGRISQAFAEAGYPGIVATNCEQTYHRYLRVGEEVSVSSRVVSVVGPKRTALGEGWFITTETTWYVGDEVVATMIFRVLRYRPPAAATQPSRVSTGEIIRPVVSRDTEFFWAGTRVGELRIQSCDACGALRHPPGPACPACGSLDRSYVVSSGAGTIFSYVVHHHPPVPGRTAPFVVALVALREGVRMLGELVGAHPSEVTVGAPVRLALQPVDDELTLPTWRLAQEESA
jgi:hypothetical protein